ncbi:GCN5-related N-acetyltransferase [Alkalihalophilus pseudofirmus OF4]|uniref:GCN5-related N-acetyltransferase n=1 Tax=Alkalihalophilus pseudofirmus (strain ATCC BAA-2126 / JCM 17055 / OF4) TaxID=398511 RepID=D3FRF0_ALKPO|nr:GNAT family N-acetyltransferase [Alkalihalophilus pseudofirmus]ADC51541.1 GCN5-related N-acetyltransferase [Alkalihalophilus pseudofirmus OF4]
MKRGDFLYKTRWATADELPIMSEYWCLMANEMADNDGTPEPDNERVYQVKELFINEYKAGHLAFRVAVDKEDRIIACAGGLIRTEYAYPLAEEPTLFGWIISVYTNKAHRKQGLAKDLIDEICLWLKENGANRARLWSSSLAKNMYEELGFQQMFDLEKKL